MSLRVGGSYGELFSQRGGTRLPRASGKGSAALRRSASAVLSRWRESLRGGSSLASSVEAPFGSPRSFSGEGRLLLPFASTSPEPSLAAGLAAMARTVRRVQCSFQRPPERSQSNAPSSH